MTATEARQAPDHTVYAAVEVSRKRWVVALHVPHAGGVGLHNLPAADTGALVGLVERAREALKRKRGVRPRVLCAYEAGYEGFWLARRLAQLGVEALVLDPASLPASRKARRTKTDRLDAAGMVRALMAFDRGEGETRTVSGTTVEGRGRIQVGSGAAPKDDGGTGAMIARLVRLRGVGANDAALLAREVFCRGFRNRCELAGWAGLAPVPWASGAVVRSQGIDRAGSPWLRAQMVQLAWRWLRHQPESARSGWFRARAGASGGRGRRVFVIALARKLLVALWRYATNGVALA